MDRKHDVMLLAGVTGSQAHGLSTEYSDVDRHGIFAQPTQEVLSLDGKLLRKEEEGSIYWEAGHALKLALSSNPSVLELLWLPWYEEETDLGWDLVHLRQSVVCARGVHDSYLRGAESLMRKAAGLHRRMNKFGYVRQPHDEENLEKFVRHAARLLLAGSAFWETGELRVRVSDTEGAAIRIATEAYLGGDDSILRNMHEIAQSIMAGDTPIREEPATEAANSWLLKVRREHWREANAW